MKSRLQWAAYIARMGVTRNACRILEENVLETVQLADQDGNINGSEQGGLWWSQSCFRITSRETSVLTVLSFWVLLPYAMRHRPVETIEQNFVPQNVNTWFMLRASTGFLHTDHFIYLAVECWTLLLPKPTTGQNPEHVAKKSNWDLCKISVTQHFTVNG